MLAARPSQFPRIQKERVMSKFSIESGRPRLLVDFGLILDLRESENLGWSRVATEYIKRTGQYISKQTCKRRYEEVKSTRSVIIDPGKKSKFPRAPPDRKVFYRNKTTFSLKSHNYIDR